MKNEYLNGLIRRLKKAKKDGVFTRSEETAITILIAKLKTHRKAR